MTMTSMPIESAVMQSRGDQPSWTPNDHTGAIPRYMPDSSQQEYTTDNAQVESHNPVYSNDVDLAGFLKAQVSFQTEQTLFLEQGRSLQDNDYVRALARFSRAQSALIRAHNALLSQLGVL